MPKAKLTERMLTVTIPEDLHKKLKSQARREGRIMRRVLVEFVEAGLQAKQAPGVSR